LLTCKRLKFVLAVLQLAFSRTSILEVGFETVLYIACDVYTDIAGDIMAERWAKRIGGVPRGLLRFLVLNMLVKKPMSGVEIVELITKETGGRWIPSSGSVYPLLASLHDKGFTTELPSEETGVKRYALTPKGKALFEKQITLGQKMLNKLEFLVPLLIGRFQLDPSDEELLEKTKEPTQRVVKTLFDIRAERNYRMTEEDAKKIERILNKCADDLEELMQKMRIKTISKKNSKLKSAKVRTV
jgi:DNA-binding PadR family transcriptional regulator